ncbi:MAG: hypothetical protein JO061_11830 [Acidobacteriaceae bacterium]|nr:hypothetical protein [Acidobacteriaceae bacterium]
MPAKKLLFVFVTALPVFAGELTPFAGGLGAITALSTDAASAAISQGISASQYKQQDGAGLQLFAGAHINDWISGEITYVWRHNDLSVVGTSSAPGDFFTESRRSSQSGLVVEGMLYFRPVRSRIRPYLATGFGFVRFQSSRISVTQEGPAAVLPAASFSSVRPVLDVPVGIDLFPMKHIAFRYSFGETLRHNDVSDQLIPRGTHTMQDFQNMFGIVFQR